jgi:hypothetical protein
MKQQILIWGILVLCSDISCQPASAQQAAFEDKYWQLVTITVSPAVDLDLDGTPDTDMRILLEDCDKDDAEMFSSHHKILKHTGTIKCDEEQADEVESGTWEYEPASKKLTTRRQGADPQTLTVAGVTSNRLVLHYTLTAKDGDHLVTAIFKVK